MAEFVSSVSRARHPAISSETGQLSHRNTCRMAAVHVSRRTSTLPCWSECHHASSTDTRSVLYVLIARPPIVVLYYRQPARPYTRCPLQYFPILMYQ